MYLLFLRLHCFLNCKKLEIFLVYHQKYIYFLKDLKKNCFRIPSVPHLHYNLFHEILELPYPFIFLHHNQDLSDNEEIVDFFPLYKNVSKLKTYKKPLDWSKKEEEKSKLFT